MPNVIISQEPSRVATPRAGQPYHTIPTLSPQTPSRDTHHSSRYASKLFGGVA